MALSAVAFIGIYLLLSASLGISLTATLGLIHLVIIPLIFKYSTTFQQQLVFLNYVQWPIHSNFSNPSEFGIGGGRNFYLKHESKVDQRNISIGAWHVLPHSVYTRRREEIENAEESDIEEIFNYEMRHSGKPVVMYCHGNANHRAAHHRVKLYQVLQEMDVHVIAFDYRGYGDSSFVLPTEAGVVEDSLHVYAWLKGTVDNETPVYVWGHSLGSGIASHMMSRLSAGDATRPCGLILESPFNNLRDEVDGHFMTFMVRWLPYFETSFVRPFSTCARYEFRSDRHLAGVRALPVMILHARDDYVVPYRLGVKLYESIVASRADTDGPVTLHAYCSDRKLGHTWICCADDLSDVFRNFRSSCEKS